MAASIIQANQGNDQTVELLQQFPVALQVKVYAGLLVPLANELIQWSVPQPGASVASGHFTGDQLIYLPVYSTTNAQGIATAPALKANENVGAWQVTAIPQSNQGLSALFDCANVSTNLTPVLTTIVVTGGNDQTIAKNSTSLPITATFYDQFGHILAGVAAKAALNPVFPTVTMLGSGTYYITGTTNASGQFSCTVVAGNIGLSEGPVTFDVNFSQNVPFPILFGVGNITVIDPVVPVKLIPISGSYQIANASAAFAAPLVVQAVNGIGGGVTGITVHFAAPGSGASCTPVTQDRVSVAGGNATTGTLTANATVGGYVVTASTTVAPPQASVPSVTLSLTNASTSGPNADENLIFCEA